MSLGRAESPVVDITLRKREYIKEARNAVLWGLLNLMVAVAFYIDITSRSLMTYLNLNHPLFLYLEVLLLAVFSINAVLNLLKYLTSCLSSSQVELSYIQKKLLGVKESDPGFKTSVPQQSALTSPAPGLQFSPACYTPHGPGGYSSFMSGSYGMSPSLSTPSTTRHTPPGGSPLSHSPGSPYTPTQSPRDITMTGQRSLSSLSAGYSPTGYASSPGSSSYLASMDQSSFLGAGSISTSFNKSVVASPLSTTNTLSPLFKEAGDTSGLRARFHALSPRSSPLTTENYISDHKMLDSFLREQEEKEMKSQRSSPDQSTSGGPSFWSFNRTFSDYTPILRRSQYQIACRSPTAAKSRDTDADESTTYAAEEVWARVGVHLEEVEGWVENLRKWLCGTILARLVAELDKINRDLERIGSEDLRVGEVSISTLKQVAVNKSQYVPSLNQVVPYLEVSTNQEYLVNRIKELASGGSMSAFRWNGGGDYKGKPWEEHLPTDSAIMVHLLCTYMDSRLPPHPKYPDGKTFTTQHFIKVPDKPNLEKKDNLFIYQTRQNPPHYKVVLTDDIYNLPKGRANMFQAILLFLHHIQSKEHGMLGRVNLGMSGVNVLWVLNRPTGVALTSTHKNKTARSTL